MSEEINKSLSLFMKKQISEKSSKNKMEQKAAASAAKAKDIEKKKKDAEKDGSESGEEEMSDEEKLEEAKKASRNKAAERDQTKMFKKMILEAIVKYGVIIAVLVMMSIGLIKFGPAIFEMMNGLISKILFGAIKKH